MSALPDHPRKHPISAEEYLRMGEAGVFAPEARLELIEGEIIEMAPIGSPHSGCVNRLTRLLIQRGGAAVVAVQNPVIISNLPVPQPDRAELWVVDVDEHAIHVFRNPTQAGYGEAFRVQGGQRVACAALPAVSVDAAEIFPG